MRVEQQQDGAQPVDGASGAGGEHPVFSQPIVSGDQCIGGTINIDFQVKGSPEPQLQWFKNNRVLSLGGRINLFGGQNGGWYTLQISNLCLEDQGEYTFIAENHFGEATCVVNLQDVGLESPNDPAPMLATDGPGAAAHASTRVRAISTGSGPAPRSDRIAPYAVPGLHRNTDMTDGGAGEEQAEQPYQPPVFYGQPVVKGDLREGGKMVMDIKLAAHPEPRIHWFKDGRPGIFSERIRLERGMGDTYKLVIKDLRPDDEGQYSFIAENYLGRNARTIYISNLMHHGKGEPQVVLLPAKDPPHLTCPRIIGEVRPGNQIHVEFDMTGSDPPPNVKLFHDGILIQTEGGPNGAGNRIWLKRPMDCVAGGKYVFTFRDLNRADEGSYRIVAENGNGSNFTTFNLTGLTPAPQPPPPEPAPPRQRQRPWRSVSPAPAPPPMMSTTLTRSPPSPPPSKYQIEPAEQPVAPKFSEPLITGDMYIGGRLRIDLSLTGTPEPTMRWYKNGHDMGLLGGPGSGGRLQLESKVGNKYVLVLPHIQVGDEGEYELVAENAVGEAICVLQLTPMPRPPSPPRRAPVQPPPPVSQVSVKEQSSHEYRWSRTGATFEPPKFSKPEVTGDMIVGGTVNVFFLIKGTPPPEVTFFKNGMPVSFNSRVSITKHDHQDDNGNCAYTLTIRGIRYDDEAEYMIKASNPVGEAKCTITLTIERAAPSTSGYLYDMVPPKFTQPIQTRIEGDVAYLEGMVTGSPRPTVSWWKDGHEIRRDRLYEPISDASGHISLRIGDLVEVGGGELVCKAVNSAGIATCSVHLPSRMIPEPCPPVFAQPIVPTIEGDTAVLDCVVQVDRSSGCDIQWYKDGRLIHHGGNFEVYTCTQTGTTTLVVHNFKSMAAAGGSEYVCRATSRSGETASCSLKLIIERSSSSVVESSRRSVSASPSRLASPHHRRSPFVYSSTQELVQVTDTRREPPKFVTHITPSIDGKYARFSGRVTGYPRPVVTWYRNKQQVYPGSSLVAEEEPDGSVSLTVYDADRFGNCEYQCVAENDAGVATSTIEFIHEPTGKPPKVVKQLTPVIDGDRATFSCQVAGDPMPDIVWLRNGQIITSGGDFHIEIDRVSGRCTLTIDRVKEHGNAEYTCRASNQWGTSSTTVELVLQRVKKQTTGTPPKFVQTMKPSIDGVTAKFECVIHGSPTPEVLWFKDGVQLPLHEDNYDMVHERSTGYCCLTIYDIYQCGSGGGKTEFVCKAMNQSGITSCCVTLVLEESVRRVEGGGGAAVGGFHFY